MKYKSLIITTILALAVVVSIPTVKAMQSYFSIASSATATSTTFFLSPGAGTTTYALTAGFGNALSGVDQSNLFIQITASTSASIINWSYQYSNNNLDWFNYTAPISPTTAAGNYVYSSSTALVNVFQANSTTASTTGIVVTVPPIASLYKRVVFTAPVGAASSSVWVQDTEKFNAQGGN